MGSVTQTIRWWGILLCASVSGLVYLGTATSVMAVSYSARAQVSGEVDTNIREDHEQAATDEAFRFFSSLRASGGFFKDIKYRIIGNGGLRGYRTLAEENRLVGQTRLSVSRAWENGFQMEALGAFFVENYRQGWRDNITYLSRLEMTLPTSYSALHRIVLAYQYLNNSYMHNQFFNQGENRLDVRGFQPITRRFTIMVATGLGIRDFNRAPEPYADERTGDLIQPFKSYQEDFFVEPEISLQYYRHILLEFNYMFREYRSNSKGFSFREHRIGMVIGSRFIYGSTIKILANISAKQYREKEPSIIIDLDEDREADNRGVIEISRNLNDQTALEFQYELYHNESRLRRRYYSKSVISLGLQYRL